MIIYNKKNLKFKMSNIYKIIEDVYQENEYSHLSNTDLKEEPSIRLSASTETPPTPSSFISTLESNTDTKKYLEINQSESILYDTIFELNNINSEIKTRSIPNNIHTDNNVEFEQSFEQDSFLNNKNNINSVYIKPKIFNHENSNIINNEIIVDLNNELQYIECQQCLNNIQNNEFKKCVTCSQMICNECNMKNFYKCPFCRRHISSGMIMERPISNIGWENNN